MLQFIHQLLPKIIFLSILFSSTVSDNLCGDWEPYKDEKCLKIFEGVGLASYDDADNFCRLADDSHLITIGNEEKQNFIVEFFKSKDVVDNVWIGLKYTDGSYEWTDATELHYTNWAQGSPKNDSNNCVQIQVDREQYGKWSESRCNKRNLLICEKIQSWSQDYLQNEVIELQFAVNQSKQNEERLENITVELSTRLSDLENTMTVVQRNPFPVGFIYVQLPNEQAPTEIWSWMEWQDVSQNYAGVFFRVEGGNSAAFGKVQGENSPKLNHIKKLILNPGETMNEIDITADGKPSEFIDSEKTGQNNVGFQFTVSGGEVRPRNMAIRVWKRIK